MILFKAKSSIATISIFIHVILLWPIVTSFMVTNHFTLKPAFSTSCLLVKNEQSMLNHECLSRMKRTSAIRLQSTNNLYITELEQCEDLIKSENHHNNKDNEHVVHNEQCDQKLYYPPRHYLFENTNVISHSIPIPKSNFWTLISPTPSKQHKNTALPNQSVFAIKNLFNTIISPNKKVQNNNSRGSIGMDTSIEFQNPKEGSIEIIRKCSSHFHPSLITNYDELEDFFTNVFTYYQSFFPPSTSSSSISHDSNDYSFKARIVSSKGQIGQKCPRWHIDHVPLRLVLSIVGPGCVYIPHELEHNYDETTQLTPRLRRDALNDLDVENTQLANSILLPNGESDDFVRYAKEGDAILLMGGAWVKEVATKNETQDDEGIKHFHDTSNVIERGGKRSVGAVAHRSPELGSEDVRILLTVDIIPRNIV